MEMVAKGVFMRASQVRLLVILFTFTSITYPNIATALDTKTSFCKSMLNDVKIMDALGRKLQKQYVRDYDLARKAENLSENIAQTRSLLELYENDRTIFLRALESKKCLTKTELLNLNETLANTESNIEVIKSWIDVGIGIPGQNFYSSYMSLPKYLTTPQVWSFCEKNQARDRLKKLTCKKYENALRWISDSYRPSQVTDITWPTGFIEGKVNLIEAKSRIVKYFEENSVAASTSGASQVEFMKKTSYPGLFNFETEPKLSSCQKFIELQDSARGARIKFVVSTENIRPNPDWIILDNSQGELIVNQKFKGQIFTIPVKIEASIGDQTLSGNTVIRHLAIIDGVVYRFSAC